MEDEHDTSPICYFVRSLEYMCFRKTRYPQNEQQSVTKVKSRNTLLPVILLYIRNYLKSVLRYKFLILDTCHPDTLYIREQGCEES